MFNKFFSVLVFFIIFFVLSFSQTNALNLPDWYRNEKNSTKLYIYGTGSGSTLEKAVEFALYDIKNKFIAKNGDDEKKIYENIKHNINTNYNESDLNIDLLNFSNYKIEKVEKINDYYYVLINIKRNELFNLQKQQLDEILQDLNKLYLLLSKKNNFAKVNGASNIFRLVDEVRNKVKIVKLIDNFNGSKYLELCKRVEKEYRNILENLDIRIIFEKQDLVPLLEVISNNIISNNHIKINERSKNILSVSYVAKSMVVNNNYNVDMLFYVKITDKSNDLVHYNSFNYSFSSTKGLEDAVENIIVQFKNDLEENKITIKFIDYNKNKEAK